MKAYEQKTIENSVEVPEIVKECALLRVQQPEQLKHFNSQLKSKN